MQPLTDGPRLDLVERVVRELLQSERAIQITYGADALSPSFGKVADISNWVSEGKVDSKIDQTIHRTINISIDSDVTAETGWSYLSGYVKPYMVFTDVQNGDSARFNLGVYSLTTPSNELGTLPATLQFAGYDLIYLLNQPIGDSYEVGAGSDPAQAAAEVVSLAVPDADVVAEESGAELPAQLSWPFDPAEPTTYLAIVQTLLDAIGYRPVWVDWDGRFRIEPFRDLRTEPIEWTFDLDADVSIVGESRKQDIDIFNVPNWWRFVMADLTEAPVEGETMFTYEDDSPENPGSTVNRGREVRHIEAVSAVSFEDLRSYAERRIADTLEPGEALSVTTQPFPLAWHYDVIEYLDRGLEATLPVAGLRRLVVATEWSLDLTGVSDMAWVWRTITEQSAGLDTVETEAPVG